MIVLCDNDIVLKLASFDLLEDITLLGESGEVRVLDALGHRLRDPGNWRKKYASQALQRALAFVEAADIVENELALEDGAVLGEAKYENGEGRDCEIDGGELILMSHAFRVPGARLITGDKRCLFALGCHRHANAHAKAIHASLTRRVVCLETALLSSIQRRGFEAVRARVVPQCNCDSAVRAIFGSGLMTKEENVLAALESYITHLEKTVGPEWLWRP